MKFPRDAMEINRAKFKVRIASGLTSVLLEIKELGGICLREMYVLISCRVMPSNYLKNS